MQFDSERRTERKHGASMFATSSKAERFAMAALIAFGAGMILAPLVIERTIGLRTGADMTGLATVLMMFLMNTFIFMVLIMEVLQFSRRLSLERRTFKMAYYDLEERVHALEAQIEVAEPIQSVTLDVADKIH